MSERKEKFTPGPWEAHGKIICPKNQKDPFNTEVVCRINENCFYSRELGNAYLIAAAPEMYFALRDMVWAANDLLKADNGEGNTDCLIAVLQDEIDNAEAVLKKARGEE